MRHRNRVHFIRQSQFSTFFDPKTGFSLVVRYSEAEMRENLKTQKVEKSESAEQLESDSSTCPRVNPRHRSPTRQSSRPNGTKDLAGAPAWARYCHVFGRAKNESTPKVFDPRRQKTFQRSYEAGAPRGGGGRGGGSPR